MHILHVGVSTITLIELCLVCEKCVEVDDMGKLLAPMIQKSTNTIDELKYIHTVTQFQVE